MVFRIRAWCLGSRHGDRLATFQRDTILCGNNHPHAWLPILILNNKQNKLGLFGTQVVDALLSSFTLAVLRLVSGILHVSPRPWSGQVALALQTSARRFHCMTSQGPSTFVCFLILLALRPPSPSCPAPLVTVLYTCYG